MGSTPDPPERRRELWRCVEQRFVQICVLTFTKKKCEFFFFFCINSVARKCMSKRSPWICNGIFRHGTSALVDKDHTLQVWLRGLGQRPFDLLVLHKNHNSPEFFSEGAELANQEVPLPARVDMLWSFSWRPQDAFEKAAITLQSVNNVFF